MISASFGGARLAAGLGGGVDQDVDPAERRRRLRDHGADRGVVAGVDVERHDLAPGRGAQLGRGRLEASARSRAAMATSHPFERQLTGDGLADTPAAAGHERPFCR